MYCLKFIFKGAGGLRPRWDFLALKSTILSQLIPDCRIRVQMDALKGIKSFIKIGDLHDHHQGLLLEPVHLLLMGKFKPLKTSFLANMGIVLKLQPQGIQCLLYERPLSASMTIIKDSSLNLSTCSSWENSNL